MKISIISFTRSGRMLAGRLAKELAETDKMEIQLYTKYRGYLDEEKQRESVLFVEGSVGEWAKAQLQEKNATLFIGACGIAVRAVAPYLTDKLHDPAVLVMDEKGRYVIPILSGHMGGANGLAEFLAGRTGAQPVITTATDIGGMFAVDLFAKRNGLSIINREGIAAVSAKVLAGEKITLSIERGHIKGYASIPEEVKVVEYPPEREAECPIDEAADISRKEDSADVAVTSRREKAADVAVTSRRGNLGALLVLRPKEYVIGLGCKKGKQVQEIESFISEKLKKLGILPEEIWALASITLKKEEPGILAWCRKTNIPFFTYTPQELMETEGEFTGSLFVQEQVGVDNVCERAAMKACGMGGRLIAGKYAQDGMTIAVAKREWSVNFDGE